MIGVRPLIYWVFCFMIKKEKYCVYILVKDKKPIYVGCTFNIRSRISKHKTNKSFDEFIILKRYKDKKEALTAENSLIRFLSIFGGNEWINSKDILLVFEGYNRGFNDSIEEKHI